MGMTLDFEAAIKEGTAIVRAGAAIFGERGIRNLIMLFFSQFLTNIYNPLPLPYPLPGMEQGWRPSLQVGYNYLYNNVSRQALHV